MRSLKIMALSAVFASVSAVSGGVWMLSAPGLWAQALTTEQGTAAEQMPPAPLENAQGPILLTVRGEIAVSNATGEAEGEAPAPREARFDAQMLQALPRNGFSTSTIWTEGVIHFEGVDLQLLMERLGVTEGRLRVRAINDYATDIPVADLRPGGPLLADHRDGQAMTIRDKGPLWLIYPYDTAPEYRNEVAYARSVWQVDRIEVLP